MKEIVFTEQAPKVVGPYSQGVKANGFVFTAGQIGINPKTGKMVEGPIEEEVRQILKNLKAVLEAAGSSLDKVVKTTVFLRDMDDYTQVNAVYGEFFTSFPARSAVQVARLPLNVRVEIEAVALLE